MQQAPLVSVIIPMYNVEKYIKGTIESILEQSYKNIEIVVVDDGSNDKSAAIVKAFDNRKIKYFLQNNRGVSSARNRGISEAKGEYVAFLDSDDLWLPDKISCQLKRIKETGFEACYCGYKEFINFSEPFKKMPKNFYEGKILEQFLRDKTICWTSTWLIKKKLIIDNNLYFTPDCSMAEDLEFFSKVLYITPVCAVREHLALYRRRPDSLTYTPNRERENDTWKRLISWLHKNPNILNQNLDRAIEIIRNYRIAGNSIYLIFDKMYINNLTLSQVRSDPNYEFISNYKLMSTFYSLKLFMKKNIIHDEIFFKVFSAFLKLYRNIKKMNLQEEQH